MIKNIDALVEEIIDATEDSVKNKSKLISIMREHFSVGNSIMFSEKMLQNKDVSKIHETILYRIAKELNIDVNKYFGGDTNYSEILDRMIALENRVDKLEKEKGGENNNA
jgi:hypothetical protein